MAIDINEYDSFSDSIVLKEAAYFGTFETIKLLVKHGADVTFNDKRANNILH